MHLLVYSIDDRRYAINLSCVDRALLAVEATPIPHAPSFILGAINVQAEVMPLINLRKLLNLPEKEIEVTDRFIICHTLSHKMALFVDKVNQVIQCDEKELVPNTEVLVEDAVTYVLKTKEGMVFILDLELLIPHDKI